jgi:hypothetical protein
MFPLHARVMTRNGTLGKIVRQLSEYSPYEYLVLTSDGTPRILFHDHLRLAADVEQWLIAGNPWKGVERRAGPRRKRDKQDRAAQQTSGGRPAERRHAERRWIETSWWRRLLASPRKPRDNTVKWDEL